MTRDTRIQAIAGVLMVCFLAASMALAVSLSAIAGRSKLTYTDRPEEGQPAEVSVGIALGAFRGVFVNFLWIRAEEMKQEGKFYEAVQLADMITRLQPRFPRVWVFHAWNLAYNISVGTNTTEERWRWVQSGINLLRQRGIPANPNDMLIHKELGWIFLHKVGGYTDDANPYYKRMLAREWTIALGPPPERTIDDNDRDKAIARRADWLAPFDTAPDTLERLIEAQPKVAGLRERIFALGLSDNEGLIELLTRYEMWKGMQRTGQRDHWLATAGDRTRAFGALVDDPELAEAWPAYLAFLRRGLLINHYHMEPSRMIRYTREFGPLDWRHYGAHALYWSNKGSEAGGLRWTDENKRDYDFINTDRVVAQSIQELFRTGDLYFDFFSTNVPGAHAVWHGMPSVHFVKSYDDVMEGMRVRSWADAGGRRGTTPLSAGYENFLRDAISFFFARGDFQNAEFWRTKMLTYKYVNLNDRERREIWARSWEEFMEAELFGEFERPSVAIIQTTAGLQQAFAGGLLGGDNERFRAGMEWAKRVHRMFFTAQKRITMVDPNTARMELMPEDFQILAGTQFVMFMSSLGLDDAETVYDAAPDDLKAFAYDPLLEQYKLSLDDAAARPGSKVRTFDAIFPPPSSLAEVRERMQAYLDSRAKREIHVEQK